MIPYIVRTITKGDISIDDNVQCTVVYEQYATMRALKDPNISGLSNTTASENAGRHEIAFNITDFKQKLVDTPFADLLAVEVQNHAGGNESQPYGVLQPKAKHKILNSIITFIYKLLNPFSK